MSAANKVSNFVLLPELILEKSYYVAGGHKILFVTVDSDLVGGS